MQINAIIYIIIEINTTSQFTIKSQYYSLLKRTFEYNKYMNTIIYIATSARTKVMMSIYHITLLQL